MRKLELASSTRALTKMDENVEARFARKLASNDLKIRNKTLRSLKKWMIARSRVENGETA